MNLVSPREDAKPNATSNNCLPSNGPSTFSTSSSNCSASLSPTLSTSTSSSLAVPPRLPLTITPVRSSALPPLKMGCSPLVMFAPSVPGFETPCSPTAVPLPGPSLTPPASFVSESRMNIPPIWAPIPMSPPPGGGGDGGGQPTRVGVGGKLNTSLQETQENQALAASSASVSMHRRTVSCPNSFGAGGGGAAGFYGRRPLRAKKECEWVHDDAFDHCMICKAEFGLFNRKHHCRLCGHIFCYRCSSKSLPMLPTFGEGIQQLRVCSNCFANHQMAVPPDPDEPSPTNLSNRGTLKPLSNGLLCAILAFLPIPDALHRASLVSHNFYFLCHTNAIWKAVYLQRWKPLVTPTKGIHPAPETNWMYFQAYREQTIAYRSSLRARQHQRVSHILCRNIKLFCIGDVGVGKTCVINRYLHSVFVPQTFGTVGVVQRARTLKFRSPEAETLLIMLDSSGHPRYASLLPLYYTTANAICVFYDVTNLDSFDVARAWCRFFEKSAASDVVIALCGLKTHSPGRVVFADKLGSLGCRYDFLFECDAMTGEFVSDFFEATVKACVHKILTAPALTAHPPTNSTIDVLCPPMILV